MSLLEAQGWAAAAWSCIATQDNKRSQQDCWNKLGSSWLHNCGFLTEPPVVMNQMNPTIFVGNPHIFSSVKLEDFFGIPPVFLSTTFDLFLIKPWTCYRENAGSIYIYYSLYIYIYYSLYIYISYDIIYIYIIFIFYRNIMNHEDLVVTFPGPFLKVGTGLHLSAACRGRRAPRRWTWLRAERWASERPKEEGRNKREVWIWVVAIQKSWV